MKKYGQLIEKTDGRKMKTPQMIEVMDIDLLCQLLSDLGNSKPVPGFILQAGKSSQGSGSSSYEADKKYKKNLEALKKEIEEKNREIESMQSDLKDSHEKLNRIER